MRAMILPVSASGASVAHLTDVFQSYTATIAGTGAELTVTIVQASTVGSYGGFGLDNLVLKGTTPPAQGTLIVIQ